MNDKYKKWIKIAGLVLLPTPITMLILVGWGIKKMRRNNIEAKKNISKTQENDK